MRYREQEGFELGRPQELPYYAELLLDARSRSAREAPLKKVIKADEMSWEMSPHGRMKHLLNERMGGRAYSVDLHILDIPPGSRSGRHRHMAEEYLFVLEGSGYDLHWDVDFELTPNGYRWVVPEEPLRFDWEEGDAIFIPVNTVHQHFAAPGRRVRLLSGTNRLYRLLGFNDLEQIEPAPEFRGWTS